jgi:CO/xanthine dehydrogenase Mo-binding subunit
MADKLVGQNYTPLDHVAKVTGRARYAEDFRADGMLFCKLMLSERPHARVLNKDLSRALALPGVRAILTAEDVPQLGGTTEHCLTPASRFWRWPRSARKWPPMPSS